MPEKTRFLILLFTIAACVALTFYVGFIMGQQIIYSRSFYIPVVLTGLWYHKKAIYTALFLSIVYILITHLSMQVVTLISFEKCAFLIAVAYVIGLIREKQAKEKEKLRETRDYLDSLIRHANAPIVVWNPELRITSFNYAFEHLTDYAADEVMGQKLSVLFPEASRDESLGKIARTLRDEYWEVEEIPILRKDGDIRLVLWNSANIYSSDGKILKATIAHGIDITERKKAEEALIQSERLRVLGEMAGGVAHDFNNLLAIILGNAQLLERGVGRYKEKEIKERLGIIAQTAYEGGETVRRLQHFTRREVSEEEFTQLNLNEIVKSAISSTSPRWKDELEKEGVTSKIKEELEDIPLILGNRSEMMEVLTNLIFNSVEAMKEGGEVTIKTEAKNDYVYLYFSDTGEGIPRRIQNKIFDPFFTTKGPKASGLGLSVSYGIIKRHRGDMKVESKRKEGATFTINLPIPKGAPLKEEKPKELKKVPSKKILIIDDEEGVRDILGRILEDEGHRVVLEESSMEALDKLKQDNSDLTLSGFEDKFDLVLTDLGMPEMSGWELAKEVKKIDPDMPVGLITGWALAPSKEKMKTEGVDFVLPKPFDYSKVVREVNSTLKSKRR